MLKRIQGTDLLLGAYSCNLQHIILINNQAK